MYITNITLVIITVDCVAVIVFSSPAVLDKATCSFSPCQYMLGQSKGLIFKNVYYNNTTDCKINLLYVFDEHLLMEFTDFFFIAPIY